MKSVNCIIFDFDGTIADTMSEMIRIYNENHRKFGVKPVSDDELGSLRAQGPYDIMKELKISTLKLPLIMFRLKRVLRRRIPGIEPCTNMVNLIHSLKENGYRLGILSSNSVENIRLFLQRNGLDCFDFIHSSSNVFGKHRGLARIIKKSGVSEENLIYIGDEIRDIEATDRVGVPIIAVSWGYNSPESLKRYAPDYFAESPEDILRIVGRNSALDSTSST